MSTEKSHADVRCRCRATGSGGSIAHGRLVGRHSDFRVTDRRSLLAVHTGGVCAAFRSVRAVEAAEPIRGSGGTLAESSLECFAAYLLGAGLVETGGNPGVGPPAVLPPFEVLEVPAPLDDGLAGREHTDETERIYEAKG